MLSGIMLVIYIAIFISQIVLLVFSVRRKSAKLFALLFLSEIIPLVIAYVLMRYFDNLPGYGFMPGFTYLGEILASLGAVILYATAIVASLLVLLIMFIIKKRKQKKT